MNKQQFKRLTLVLTLPLLALGAWLASSEAIFRNHQLTECRKLEARFQCFTRDVNHKQLMDATWNSNDVFIHPSVVLTSGFNYKVRTLGYQTRKFVNGEMVDGPIEGAGEVLQLRWPNAESLASGKRSCLLSRHADSDRNWGWSCPVPLNFEFVDEQTADNFVKLAHMIRTEQPRWDQLYIMRFSVATALPLIGYFILAGLVCFLLGVFRFVRGSAPKT